MATSKAVAERAQVQVPDLVRTPALEIDAEDVALPKLKIGQFTSDAVKDQLVRPGAIFTTTSKDDPDPVCLWDPSKKDAEPVRVHVLGMRKGKSLSDGGELILFDFNDPSAPPEAWVTYNYFIALPKVDAEVPAKWLLTRSGKSSAQYINTVIKKNEGRKASYELAFDVTSAKRENAKGEFFVPQVRQVEADEADVKVARSLAEMISSSAMDVMTTGDEPAI